MTEGAQTKRQSNEVVVHGPTWRRTQQDFELRRNKSNLFEIKQSSAVSTEPVARHTTSQKRFNVQRISLEEKAMK